MSKVKASVKDEPNESLDALIKRVGVLQGKADSTMARGLVYRLFPRLCRELYQTRAENIVLIRTVEINHDWHRAHNDEGYPMSELELTNKMAFKTEAAEQLLGRLRSTINDIYWNVKIGSSEFRDDEDGIGITSLKQDIETLREIVGGMDG